MKKFLLCFAVLAAFSARATDFPAAHANNTLAYTLLTATTNQTGSAYFVEMNNHHTVHVVNATVRTNTVTLDRSLDNSTWIPWATNTFSATGSAEFVCEGKWSYMRARVSAITGTNCSVTVKYLGGK